VGGVLGAGAPKGVVLGVFLGAGVPKEGGSGGGSRGWGSERTGVGKVLGAKALKQGVLERLSGLGLRKRGLGEDVSGGRFFFVSASC